MNDVEQITIDRFAKAGWIEQDNLFGDYAYRSGGQANTPVLLREEQAKAIIDSTEREFKTHPYVPWLVRTARSFAEWAIDGGVEVFYIGVLYSRSDSESVWGKQFNSFFVMDIAMPLATHYGIAKSMVSYLVITRVGRINVTVTPGVDEVDVDVAIPNGGHATLNVSPQFLLASPYGMDRWRSYCLGGYKPLIDDAVKRLNWDAVASVSLISADEAFNLQIESEFDTTGVATLTSDPTILPTSPTWQEVAK